MFGLRVRVPGEGIKAKQFLLLTVTLKATGSMLNPQPVQASSQRQLRYLFDINPRNSLISLINISLPKLIICCVT